MRLLLKSDLKNLQDKLSEYEQDNQISNIEVINFSKLADSFFDNIKDEHFIQSKEIIQTSVDDISQALQKMAIAIEKKKSSQAERDAINEATQFQLAQLIVNYNRTVGKLKFKSGF